MRVVRACRDLGLGAVAVFSECDRAARHVRMADEAVALGGNAPADSYLRIDRILQAAQVTGADAVHPGYGFLSENPDFARACHEAGLTFIGPSPDAVARVGSKTTARQIAASAGVPVVTGTEMSFGPDASVADLADAAARIGYPVLIKAVAGGGGKGCEWSQARRLQGAIRLARSRGCDSVWRFVRLSRAIPSAPETRGDSDPRGSSRQHQAICRTRVFNPATSSEGGRGITVACGRLCFTEAAG